MEIEGEKVGNVDNAAGVEVETEDEEKQVKPLTSQQLKELYSKSIKLSAENKISVKNSWQLNLIDYMDQMVNNDDGTANFIKASCTLDASVRIYSNRVDSTHQNAFRMLTCFSRTTADREEKDTEGGEVKKKDKRLARVDTLESNIENLNLKASDFDFASDPLFKLTTASFDEGGNKNLLLNRIGVHKNCALHFDLSEPLVFFEGESESSGDTQPPTVSLSDPPFSETVVDVLKAGLNLPALCPSLGPFSFNSNSPNPAPETQSDSSLPDTEDVDELTHKLSSMDMSEDLALPELVPLSAFAGNEFPLLPDSVDDDDGDEGAPGSGQKEWMDQPSDSNNAKNTGALTAAEFIRTGMGSPASDFAFFAPSQLRNWAGPLHWRPLGAKNVFFNQKSEGEGGTVADSEAKPKGKKKVAGFISFSQPVAKAKLAPAKSQAAILLSDASRKAQNAANCLLPEDHHVSALSLGQCLLEPRWGVGVRVRENADRKTRQENGLDVMGLEQEGSFPLQNSGTFENDLDEDDDVFDPDTYQYEADNDCEDGSSAGGVSTPQLTVNPSTGPEALGFTVAHGLELTAVPKTVEVEMVQYARKAKKINVHLLKKTLWRQISEDAYGPAREDGAEAVKEDASEKEDEEENEKSHQMEEEINEEENKMEKTIGDADDAEPSALNFTSLCQSLATPGTFPKEMQDSLSVQFCFISLLHLANENNLFLEDVPEMTDLRVTCPPATS
eukprot:GCRY01005167.1.p1 GENE.GCRY01005167.1~~GCRY01005167.1.p1  ORF type:complete len:729 (+),score=231.96 GCRY01005167.1:232-2418(+)